MRSQENVADRGGREWCDAAAVGALAVSPPSYDAVFDARMPSPPPSYETAVQARNAPNIKATFAK